MILNFEGKTVLITGASRGIGKAVAIAFASAGAQVAVHFNQQHKLAEQVRASLPERGHIAVQADIADPVSVERMVFQTITALGHIDILVNNAGIYQDHPLHTTSYQDWQAAWQETIGINLIGAVNVSYCVARHMMERQSG